jgi:hypothetical protein
MVSVFLNPSLVKILAYANQKVVAVALLNGVNLHKTLWVTLAMAAGVLTGYGHLANWWTAPQIRTLPQGEATC